MKTFAELRQAVENANGPQQVAGTFVDGAASLFETNADNPTKLKSIISEWRSNRSSLIHSLTDGHVSKS